MADLDDTDTTGAARQSGAQPVTPSATQSEKHRVALGMTFLPTTPPEQLPELARLSEQAGLDEFWVWEDCFKHSGIASAAIALASTSRIRVGIGLLPAPLRTVAVCAMELAMLERIHPGRLIAGVGHGVQDWMGQAGARVASPLTLLEEYAAALRRLLAGETVSVQGRYVTLDRVALDWPPAPPPPLFVGGSGPRSVRLAAELGDGNLLGACMTPEQLAETSRLIRGAGVGPEHATVYTHLIATGPGARRRLDEEIPRWGGEPGRGIGVAGDAAEVAASIRSLTAYGITSVAAQPTEDEPDPAGYIAFLGEQVRPLL